MKPFRCAVSIALSSAVFFISGGLLSAQQPGSPATSGTQGTVASGSMAAALPFADVNPAVNLPQGWQADGNYKETGLTPPVTAPGSNPQSVQMMLSAKTADAKRAGRLLIYRYRFRDYAPPLVDDAGVDAETGKFLQIVVAQGYTPSEVNVSRGNAARGRPSLTVSVTAKNTDGDERIFTDTSVTDAVNQVYAYRLYTSLPVADTAGAQEIKAVIKSLSIPDWPAGAAPQQAGANSAAGATVSTPASPAAPTPGAGSATAAQIVQDYHNALILIEGKEGLGSGFLCNMGGHTCIITNAHVLAGNTDLKLTNLDGVGFSSGSSAVAVGHDIVKMEMGAGTTAPAKVFEVKDDINNTVKVGDAVMIPGNAEGANVVTAVEGRIVGVGPNLVEVDAPFVPGNSGSPIIHVASGKVLGVATYMMIKSVEKDNGKKVITEVRRFGYRLDSVKEWQPINWKAFYAESQQLDAIEELSRDFIRMFDNIDNFGPADIKNAQLARVVRNFVESYQGKTALSKADQDAIRQNFLSQLRLTTQADITAFNSQPAYDYFRRRVEEEGKFRDKLYDFFTHALHN